MSDDRVDITAEVKTICEKLGLEYHDVAELEIEPGTLQAVFYLRNENGAKYVHDGEWPVMSRTSFRVQA